jgi:diguanylate cyclase (GGDEF)-like protein/PAS domain S-box-containing protein
MPPRYPGTVGRQTTKDSEDVSRLRAARDAALQAAQAAVRDATRLTRLLTILSEPAPLELLLDRVLSALSELFSADIVALLDPAETGRFCPLAAIGLPEDMIQQPMSSAEGGYVATVMRHRQAVMTAEAMTDPKVDHQLREAGAETLVWLPVVGTQAARGVLILARCRPEPFGHADADILTAMAYRIGLVLEQAQRGIQLEKIVQANSMLGRHLDEETIATEAVGMFPAVVGADAAALVLNDRNGTPRRTAQFGLDPSGDFAWSRLSEYLRTNASIVEGQPYYIPDLQSVIPDLQSVIEQFTVALPDKCPVRALLAVPIRRDGQTKGLLYAMRSSAAAFSPGTIQMAQLYSGQMSAALENASLYRAVREELAERARAEQALRASDEKFRAMISSVSDVIAILDADGTIRYASPACLKMWGCPAETLPGSNVLHRVHHDDAEKMHKLLAAVIEQPNATLTDAVRLRQGQETWRSFEVILTNLLNESAVAGVVATYHDVTERITFEQKLTKLAFRDPLTGLANRAHFKDRLQQALVQADARGRSVALIFFDLDNFKIVNDSLGHACGDRVLRVVADRLRSCLRRDDTAGRFGGDEFTVLIDNITGLSQVMPIVDRLRTALRDPIRIEGRDLFIGGSIGIALSTPNQDSTDDLLRKADLAMYHAKVNGKGCHAIFDAKLNAAAMERLELETELRLAIERKELRVYYQPIVSLRSKRICEVEALIRWQHPRMGLVLPSRIIPIAEETGLIIDIGQWVLEEACRQVRTWQLCCPGKPLQLSVNLSARQFRHANLVNEISLALRESALDPSNLTIEITESDLIHDPAGTIEKLMALKATGVRLAIDDFGTGYSSLSYLKQFPVDTLKIDRSFVQGIEADPYDRAIAQSVIALASALGLSVIGEGIETVGQAAQLRSLGCRRGQGYLFARPLPADLFQELLIRERSGIWQSETEEEITASQIRSQTI